ncbi:MAG: Glu/Leu/Phe/Val dehydrogenase [Gammaproteobacteria bacterium]
MKVFKHPEYDAHERLVFCHDKASGLNAIIAIHSTSLGPAAGGCRMWSYANDDEALTDALRLSRGMSYKNALAEIRFGGGKAVILGDAAKDKTAELFRAFGRAVEAQSGDYITAEDVGVRVADMEEAATQTRFVSGLSQRGSAAGGDPSPWTARGVFVGIREAVTHHLGATSLQGVRVAVQGLGGVGYHLCRHLHDAGALLTVADINLERCNVVRKEFDAAVVGTDEIIGAAVDVFAPCALGAVINERSLGQIKASVVAGAANNQLETPEDGEHLRSSNILYVPDYVINAGGIISAEGEYYGDVSEAEVAARVDAIGPRLKAIFLEASATDTGTHVIADALAQARILEGRAEPLVNKLAS